MKLVVLGPPGAGKGTQAKKLAQLCGIAHISSGDILRQHMAQNTEIGEQVRETISAGGFAPDEIVTQLVLEQIGSGGDGFVLDGFPRNIRQAMAMEKCEALADIDKVISFEVDEALIIERMSGRLTCPGCGAMFHKLNSPPKNDGVCDACGSPLRRREDDEPETVLRRLKLFRERTEPIISFYKERGVLSEVDASGDMQEVAERVEQLLKEAGLYGHTG